MKILLFTDCHPEFNWFEEVKSKSREADFLIHAGDFSNFAKGLDDALGKINSLGKVCYVIHGNHEEGIDFAKLVLKYENLRYIHKKIVNHEGLTIGGYGGDGFSFEDSVFAKLFKNKKIDILVTHGPAFNTKLDYLYDEHVGNITYREIIEKIKPKLHVSGHIHEKFGEVDNIDETILINPGPGGMLIEL